MSILFGIRKTDGNAVEESELREIAQTTAIWAPDGTFLQRTGSIGMGLQPYHTHSRSHLGGRPVTDSFGNMVTFDGRLDNQVDLIRCLSISDPYCSDPIIALEAFRRWGEACFEHFVGDWAMALWIASTESLYIARDHAGTRTLYYEQRGDAVIWSTFLESFSVGGRRRELDDSFAAAYLTASAIGSRTPYRGVRAVPPAHSIRFARQGMSTRRHWNPVVDDTIHYRDEGQYDERFLEVFEQSVRRRIGTSDPVIAHLSGGMDSSAIVCMSDKIRQKQNLDPIMTLSFFDDTEPTWNERPYFSAVEVQRNQAGIHLAVSMAARSLRPHEASDGGFLPLGGDSSMVSEERRLADAFAPNGYRAILAGVGGDELLGGSLTSLPELASKAASLEWRSLLRSSVSWCVPSRYPLFLLLRDLLGFLINLYLPGRSRKRTPPWLRVDLDELGDDGRDGLMPTQRLGHSPRALANGLAWCCILETLPNANPPMLARYEYRFPYLDRDLVEYLLRVPYAQMTRPGRRRLMMRRALRGIVPEMVLERPRKGYVIRAPLAFIRDRRDEILGVFERPPVFLEQLIDIPVFKRALDKAIQAVEVDWISHLLKTIDLAIWVRSRNGLSLPGNSPKS